MHCALNQNPYQLEPYCDLQLQDSLYFSMHLRDVLKCNACIHTYMHAQFAALMTLPTTEPRRMPIVSCALIYDTAIRVSAVTADRTGKFALLTYSLTAYHCSTEARLAGVQFPPSFDSRLVLRQSRSTRLEVSFYVDAKLSRVAEEVAKFRSGDSDACAENSSHSARLLLQQSRASYMLPFLPSGSPYIKS